MSFNWQIATDEELAEYIATISSAHLQSQIAFYTRKGDTVLVQRIEVARKFAVAIRLQNKAEKLLKKLNTERGEKIANLLPEENNGLDRC